MTTATDDSRRVLELLAQGKITVDEADQLLRALPGSAAATAADPAADAAPKAPARWVKVTIDKAAKDGRPPKQVAIRVPMALLRGGVKLGAMIPRIEPINRHLREQGIDVDLSTLDFAQIETVLNRLGETSIDVDDGKARVRISCE
jgi:hypothetical protein